MTRWLGNTVHLMFFSVGCDPDSSLSSEVATASVLSLLTAQC